MKKYLSAFTAFCFIASSAVIGQDIHFSQYNLSPLLLNPSLAGASKSHEVIMNYKNQWSSIAPDAGYKTSMLSYSARVMEKKLKSKWFSAGVSLFNDEAGEGNMKTLQGNVFLGYHIKLDRLSILGGGLTGGFAQRRLDYSKLMWDSQYINGAYDPGAQSNEAIDNARFGYADFGLGFLY